MTKTKYQALVVLLAILWAGFIGYAQQAESSLLWKISGNNLTEESYIFGTIHMICKDDFVLKEKVVKAFEASKQMCFELDLSNPSELMMMDELLYKEVAISSQLDAISASKLDQILRLDYQTSLKAVDHWPSINIISLMLIKAAECSNLEYYDLVLMEMGLREKKKMFGLESISEQFELVESLYSAKEVLAQLEALEVNKQEFKKLVQLYLAEDIDRLLESSKSQEFSDAVFMKRFLTDRNYQWSLKIPKLIASQSTFIAVGAAHLAGKQGVLQLLRDQGYSVVPVL